jgi:hypothetical protein
VQLEAWYVRNWTFWLDCIVLAKTFRTVLFPENDRRVADVPDLSNIDERNANVVPAPQAAPSTFRASARKSVHQGKSIQSAGN